MKNLLCKAVKKCSQLGDLLKPKKRISRDISYYSMCSNYFIPGKTEQIDTSCEQSLPALLYYCIDIPNLCTTGKNL